MFRNSIIYVLLLMLAGCCGTREPENHAADACWLPDGRNAKEEDLDWFKQVVSSTVSNRMNFGWVAGSTNVVVKKGAIPMPPVAVIKARQIEADTCGKIRALLLSSQAPTGKEGTVSRICWLDLVRQDGTQDPVRLKCEGEDVVSVWRIGKKAEEETMVIYFLVPGLSQIVRPLIRQAGMTEQSPEGDRLKAPPEG